jgi:Bacterial lipid A biosynthesis acyltransferase
MPYRGGLEAAVRPLCVYGLEYLQDSLKRGSGAILWESGYFGRRNLAKHILYQNGFSIDQVHASGHTGGFGASSDNQSWTSERIIRPFFDSCERSFVRDIIYLGDPDSLTDTRIILSRLKNNRVVCISADGTRGHRFLSVPFLGRSQSIPTGIVSLARLSATPILPLFCFADNQGKITLVIKPRLQMSPNLRREEALKDGIHQFVALLECYVRMYPEQYRKWDHILCPKH